MFTALSIAGSDSSGGAGIQADIKTMSAHGIYAMTAITALTAQNTTGVFDILEATPEFLCRQLDAIFTDIYPDAVKIGMLSNQEIMQVVESKLLEYKARHIVLDPVMVATSGASLMKDSSAKYLIDNLMPIAEIITPNIGEAEVITGLTIKNAADMETAGVKLYETIKARKQSIKDTLTDTEIKAMYDHDTAVLIKGGHSINDANDLLVQNGRLIWIEGDRIDNPNTHGTGCTLSSAIASNLAKGIDVESSVKNAKTYISGALRAGLNLGQGSGPLNHLYKISE